MMIMKKTQPRPRKTRDPMIRVQKNRREEKDEGGDRKESRLSALLLEAAVSEDHGFGSGAIVQRDRETLEPKGGGGKSSPIRRGVCIRGNLVNEEREEGESFWGKGPETLDNKRDEFTINRCCRSSVFCCFCCFCIRGDRLRGTIARIKGRGSTGIDQLKINDRVINPCIRHLVGVCVQMKKSRSMGDMEVRIVCTLADDVDLRIVGTLWSTVTTSREMDASRING
jgi:hypothetical protein